MGEGAATFLAEAKPFLLLFVGGCVKCTCMRVAFCWCGYQEDYRMHLTFYNSMQSYCSLLFIMT